MEGSKPNQSPKWPSRLTILFAILFALFWSLGSFFFWSLLGLTVYFGFLTLYTSDSVKIGIDNLIGSLNQKQRPSRNSHRASQSGPDLKSEPPTALKVVKFIRGIMTFLLALFLLFFFIGLFSGNDEDGGEGEVIDEDVSVTSNDDETTIWNERGNAALQNDKSDSAFYYYNKALAIDPENMYALYNKGLAYTLRQDYGRANGLARRCVQYHPDYYPAWWLLGYNYDLISNTDSAIYCLEKAYSGGYRQPDFVQLMAEVYIKKNRQREAIEAYQQLIEMDTTRADIFRKMAELDPSNAERYLRKARALDGN